MEGMGAGRGGKAEEIPFPLLAQDSMGLDPALISQF